MDILDSSKIEFNPNSIDNTKYFLSNNYISEIQEKINRVNKIKLSIEDIMNIDSSIFKK